MKLSMNNPKVLKAKEKIEELYAAGIHDKQQLAQYARTNLDIVEFVLSEVLQEERFVDRILAQQRVYAKNEALNELEPAKEKEEVMKVEVAKTARKASTENEEVSIVGESPMEIFDYLPIGLMDYGALPRSAKTFIFDKLSNAEFFDFDYQESVISEFIAKYIHFGDDGTPQMGIKAYVWDSNICAAPVASLIKVAMKKGISLKLMHWNPSEAKYFAQEILTGKVYNDATLKLGSLLYNIRKASLFHCSLEELVSQDVIYDCEMVKQNPEHTWWVRKKVFCKALQEVYQVFIQYSMQIPSVKNPNGDTMFQLYLHKNTKVGESYNTETIQKSYF